MLRQVAANLAQGRTGEKKGGGFFFPHRPFHEPVDGGQATTLVRDIIPGPQEQAYGIACDIGSTTIAMHLSSLLSGRTLPRLAHQIHRSDSAKSDEPASLRDDESPKAARA